MLGESAELAPAETVEGFLKIQPTDNKDPLRFLSETEATPAEFISRKTWGRG